MTEEILGHLIGRTTSASVWSCLVSMFSAQNRAGARQMRRQLTSLKKNDLTAAACFHKMKGFADAMAMVGSPISDDELIDYIVVGLGSQYESLQHSLTVLAAAGADNLSVEDFYSMLLSCEALLEQNSQAPDFSTSANAVARQGGDNRGGGRPFVDNNTGRSGGRPSGPPGGGHAPGGQQQQQGQRGNRANQGGGGDGGGGQGGGGGGGRSGRQRGTRCQICDYWGHSALQCRNRFNQAYQQKDSRSGNTASFQESQPWFFDSGATDHLTNDMSRMHVQDRYPGKDQVQVANGAGFGPADRRACLGACVFPCRGPLWLGQRCTERPSSCLLACAPDAFLADVWANRAPSWADHAPRWRCGRAVLCFAGLTCSLAFGFA
ncbi:uncharacterized protein [Lolium perenne]|uniref:uncharacterized protein n=1 Tax=Lolium perenne TaxID=4522 RepID=UPI003A996F41